MIGVCARPLNFPWLMNPPSVMQGLGEMTSYMPITGGHMMYAGRFVDPALAFAVNWAYAIEWMLVTPAE